AGWFGFEGSPSAAAGRACQPGRRASAGDRGGERVADLGGRARGGAAVREVRGDGGLDAGRRLGVAEVVEEQRDGQHGGGGVGLALAGDVRRGAVDRLEHARGRPVGVDVAGGREPDAAGDGGGEVGDDVAEEVVGDDDVEAGRVGDEEDHRGVDVQVVDGDVGELGIDPLDRP